VDPVIVVEQAFSLQSEVSLVELLLVIVCRLAVLASRLQDDEPSAVELKLRLDNPSDTLRTR